MKGFWQKFWSNPYKWGLWRWIGGRPWTFVLRDLYHKGEFIWIIGLVAIGVWMGHHFDWLEILKILGIFTLGFIFGHLFWGKPYVENQRGK